MQRIHRVCDVCFLSVGRARTVDLLIECEIAEVQRVESESTSPRDNGRAKKRRSPHGPVAHF